MGFFRRVISHSLTRSLREPGVPCAKSMEVSESRMERVNMLVCILIDNFPILTFGA